MARLIRPAPPASTARTGAAVISAAPSMDGLGALYHRGAVAGRLPELPRQPRSSAFQPVSASEGGGQVNRKWWIVFPRNLGYSFKAQTTGSEAASAQPQMAPKPAFRRVVSYPRYSTTPRTYPSSGEGNR